MPRGFTEFQKETAFDRYYAMGPERRLRTLSGSLVDTEGFPKSPSYVTLKKWSRAHNWQERVKLRDIENSKQVQIKTDREVVNTKADYRKMIKERLAEDLKLDGYVTALIGKAKDKIEKGELSVDTIKDLAELMRVYQGATAKKVELIKADLLLIGEADSRVDAGVQINVHGVDMDQFPDPYVIKKEDEDAL